MKKLIITILLILATSFFSYGQISNTEAIIKNNEENSEISNFDLSQDKLPTDFKGVNLKLLFEKLLSLNLNPKKDQFETTDEFNKRIEKSTTNVTIGNSTLNGNFAFRVFVFEKEYNADKKVATFSRRPSSGSGFMQPYGEKKLLGVSEAQNVYGAKVKVESWAVEYYYVNVSNLSKFTLTNNIYSPITANLVMDTLTAKNEFDNIAMLFIGKLFPPYTQDNKRFEPATFNEPKNTEFIDRRVLLELTEIWYYSRKTGEVYYKQKSTK